MDSKKFQKQIQNLRNKRLVNAKPARIEQSIPIVEKTSSGAIKVAPNFLNTKTPIVPNIKKHSPVIVKTKSGGCGCSRKK